MIAQAIDFITTRKALIDDLDDIYSIEKKTYDIPWTKNILRGCIIGNYDCFVSLKDSKIIGYLISKIISPDTHILNLTVDKDYRNLGIASQFINLIISQSILYDSKAIFLETRKTNYKAINLYRKFLFKEIGIRKGYYKTKSGREDAIVFRKLLASSRQN